MTPRSISRKPSGWSKAKPCKTKRNLLANYADRMHLHLLSIHPGCYTALLRHGLSHVVTIKKLEVSKPVNPAVDLSHGLALSQNRSVDLTALYRLRIGSREFFRINADFSIMQCIRVIQFETRTTDV